MMIPMGEETWGAALTKVTRARKKMAALENMVNEMFGQGGKYLECGMGKLCVRRGSLYPPLHAAF